VSAAFQLDFTGPATACDYPGCLLHAFHEGDHQFAALKTQFPLVSQYNRTCAECGVRFVVMGDATGLPIHTCGAEKCLLSFARKHSANLPVTCTCAQRPYPHELSIHKKIGLERPGVYYDYYDTAVRFAEKEMRWPWTLRFAPEMEA
jgi:hypothetical protein